VRGLSVGLFVVWLILSAPAGAAERVVHLINIGWHTGIAVPVEAIDPAVLPEVRDFPRAGWIEFGWGDAEFYRDPDPAIATYLSALFVETPAVMHLVGLPAHPRAYFPAAEVVEVALDEAAFEALLAFIADSFARPTTGPAPALGQGLYRDSRFYDAIGTFTLSNTCNTWTARAFAAAGLIEDPDRFTRASAVTRAVRAALSGG